MNEHINTINYKKPYNGSNICIASSHLFLLASLFNYYHDNIIECISIFTLYITSIIYHYNGEKNIFIFNMFNLDYKLIDVYCCRLVICICMIFSLIKYNICPTLATIFISIMYYYKISYTNILHSILIHLPGAFGFFAIYYNTYYNNNNNIYFLEIIKSQVFSIWLSLIIITLIYLLYYDYYLTYKINLLNNIISFYYN
jgi:hypothetical protein